MYTDGSKEDKRTAISPLSVMLMNLAVVSTMRLQSAQQEYMVITASSSALQALKSQKFNNPIVSNILHICHYLSRHKDIVFCWVPSHIGIQSNEQADVLAKAALDNLLL